MSSKYIIIVPSDMKLWKISFIIVCLEDSQDVGYTKKYYQMSCEILSFTYYWAWFGYYWNLSKHPT